MPYFQMCDTSVPVCLIFKSPKLLSFMVLLIQTESIKFTRRNENVKPFEPGGESSLEFYCQKSQCGLFALGSHSKKR